MSNSIGPVDIEFILKNVNFQAEAKKMKDEISGVVDHTKVASKVMSDAMGDFANQSARQMKESIAIQKAVIRDLQQSIKELQNTATNSTGKNKTDAQSALGLAKKDLIAEQGALIAMQKQQVLANEKEASSQGGILAGLGKWVIGLASVGAAMKIGKDIIESTKDSSDRLSFAISAAESGLSYFYKSVITWDWSNYIENFKKAIRVGYEYAEMMDRVKESSWSLSIAETSVLKENAQLEVDLRDRTLSPEKRLAAGEKRIENEKVLAKERISVAQQELDAATLIATDRSKLDEKTLFNILKNTDATTKAKAEAYNKAMALKEKGVTIDKMGDLAVANNVVETATPSVKLYADALKGYGELKEEMIINYVDAINKLNKAEASEFEGTKRIRTTISTVSKEIRDESEASAKKTLDEANKRSKAQLDYDTELGRQRIANQIEIDQQTLNLQKDGAEKQRQQAELDFRKILANLANQKADQLKKLNLLNGGIDASGKPTNKYVSTLPEADQKQLDEKVILAEDTKNNAIVLINEKAAETIKEIWQEVTDYRLKGIDKEKAAVKEYYDKMEKAARDAKDTALVAAIAPLRKAANEDIDRKYALEKLDFEEKIEEQKNQIQATGYDREAKLAKLNFDTWVKFQNQRIAILKKSDDPKDQQKAELLQGDIDVAKTEKKLKEELELRREILDAAMQLANVLTENGNLTAKEAEAAKEAITAVSMLAQGNYVGAAVSAITSLFTVFMDTERVTDKLAAPWVEFEKWVSRSNDVLERYIKLRDESIGTDRYSTSDVAIQTAKDNLSEYETKINGLKLSWSFEDSGWFEDNTSGVIAEFEAKQKAIGEGILKQEGAIKLETIAGWSKAKMTASYDLSQLTTDENGNFSLTKIQKLIDEGIITDQAVIDAVKEYNANVDELIDLEKDKQKLLTDTMAGNIADSIVEGFKNGYSSAADFAGNFEDLMRNAIYSALKIKALEEPLKLWYEQFAKDMESGGGLDEKEKDRLKIWWDKIVADGKTASDAAFSAAGISPASTTSANQATGLSGSVRGATEETVGAMVGQLMAVRVDIKSILATMAMGQDDVSKNLLYLKQIAENTSHNVRLVNIEKGIDEMNATLKKGLL